MMQQFFAKVLLFLTPICLSLQLQAQDPTYYGGEAGKKLDWTLFYLNQHYVDSTNADNMAELAIIRILEELDPFSRYQSKKQLDEQRKADEGYKNDGVGLKYYIINDTATITFIDQAGPSMEAGILKGDKIISLNGVNTVGQDYTHIDSSIISDRGTVLNFSIRRDNRLLNISVTSVSLFAESVDAVYEIEENIGYIKLNRFTMKTIDEFIAGIDDLKRQGVSNLIIDLRYNRGGTVKGATDLADQFMEEGKLLMTSEGKGLPKNEILSTSAGTFKYGKVIILTNSVTASASEIFTGALQEWDRALVMGEITYGKGLIQQSYLLGDSSAVRITIGRYYTPTGRILQRPFNFDTENDWLFQNIANSTYYDGETVVLNAPGDNLWKTKSGRKILKGQGSIIPDIYLSPTVIQKPQVAELNSVGIIYQFIVHHADAYRKYYLGKYKNGNEFRLDESVDEDLKRHFSAYLLAKMDDKALAKSILNTGITKHTITQIKAWLGPQLWESGSYYIALNEADELIQKAIEAIRDKTFDEIGIKY